MTPDGELRQALDAHVASVGKPTLTVLGPPGSGKTALLADWTSQRLASSSKRSGSEFLFHHIVGCSPESRRLANMLQRLESSLKSFFGLREMEVPESESRLRWSLLRFLEAAAKKQMPTRITIVLDGVDQRL